MGEPFIDRAIAVIVDAVADFWGGEDATKTRAPLPIDAGLFTFEAGTYIDATGLCIAIFARTAVVDLAIAVIVFAIACLFGGEYFAGAHAPFASRADLFAWAAFADAL